MDNMCDILESLESVLSTLSICSEEGSVSASGTHSLIKPWLTSSLLGCGNQPLLL